MWTGELWDSKLAAAIYKNNRDDSNYKFLKIISEEAKISSLGFYDTHVFSKKFKISVPKLDAAIASLRKRKFEASRTHLSGNGIRTNASSPSFSKSLR